MNWSQTKSIFLLTFLILDLFLGYQLYSKRENTDQILQNQKTPREQMADIKLPGNPPATKSAAYIRGTSMSFASKNSANGSGSGNNGSGTGSSKKGQPANANINGSTGSESGSNSQTGSKSGSGHSSDQNKQNQRQLKKSILNKEKYNGQKVQEINVKPDDSTTLISHLTDPLKINTDSKTPDFSVLLQNYVYKGKDYTLWQKGGDNSPYIFVQTFNTRPVFSKGQSTLSFSEGNFPPGTLKVYMTDGKVTKYEQSYLSLHTYNQKKDIIAPLTNAVYNLYINNDIPSGSTVDQVELGYYNSIQSDLGKVRLFVPTWHILVNMKNSGKEKEFFVNAIYGNILTPTKQEQTGG